MCLCAWVAPSLVLHHACTSTSAAASSRPASPIQPHALPLNDVATVRAAPTHRERSACLSVLLQGRRAVQLPDRGAGVAAPFLTNAISGHAPRPPCQRCARQQDCLHGDDFETRSACLLHSLSASCCGVAGAVRCVCKHALCVQSDVSALWFLGVLVLPSCNRGACFCWINPKLGCAKNLPAGGRA